MSRRQTRTKAVQSYKEKAPTKNWRTGRRGGQNTPTPRRVGDLDGKQVKTGSHHGINAHEEGGYHFKGVQKPKNEKLLPSEVL